MTFLIRDLDPLSAGEIAVMEQLFISGPTWNGDIVCKNSRGKLFKRGYANRVEGWSFLTKDGMDIAVYGGIGEEKERRDRRRRAA